MRWWGALELCSAPFAARTNAPSFSFLLLPSRPYVSVRVRSMPVRAKGLPGLNPWPGPLVPVNPRELARSLHFPSSRSILVYNFGQIEIVTTGSITTLSFIAL